MAERSSRSSPNSTVGIPLIHSQILHEGVVGPEAGKGKWDMLCEDPADLSCENCATLRLAEVPPAGDGERAPRGQAAEWAFERYSSRIQANTRDEQRGPRRLEPSRTSSA